jgi:hypothetical protein
VPPFFDAEKPHKIVYLHRYGRLVLSRIALLSES